MKTMKTTLLYALSNVHRGYIKRLEVAAYCIMALSCASMCFARPTTDEQTPAHAVTAASPGRDRTNPESPPLAFRSSYLGLFINQNYSPQREPGAIGAPKTSWGAEYRFFYKDLWTLSVTGSFKGQEDSEGRQRSNFSISQETTGLFRIYHPWYATAGGRISYIVPVRRISIPYERDHERNMDTGGALSFGTLVLVDERLIIMLSGHRWTSFSSRKNQGFESILGLLIPFR